MSTIRDKLKKIYAQKATGRYGLAADVAEFEKLPQFEAAVRLRRIDDQAKNPTAATPAFSHFAQFVDQALMA